MKSTCPCCLLPCLFLKTVLCCDPGLLGNLSIVYQWIYKGLLSDPHIFFLSLSFNLVHSLLLQLHNQIRDSSQAFEFALRTDITSPFKTWSERLKIADGTENCIKGTKISPRSHGNSPSAKGSGDRSTDHRGHPKGKCLCCLKCVRRVEDIWAVDC